MMKSETTSQDVEPPPKGQIGGEEVREVYDVNLFQRFGLSPTPMPYTREMFRPRLYAILGIILFATLYSISFSQLGLVATFVIMIPWIFIQLLQIRNPSLHREIIFLTFPLLSIALSTPQNLGESGIPINAPPQTLGLLLVSSVGFILAATGDVVLTSWVQANFSPHQKFIEAQDQEAKEMLERSKKALQDTRFSFDFHLSEPESPRLTLETRIIRTSVLVLLSIVATTFGLIMFVQFTEQISPSDPFPLRTYLVSMLALSSIWSITMIRGLLRQEFNEFYIRVIKKKTSQGDEKGTSFSRQKQSRIERLFSRMRRNKSEKQHEQDAPPS